MLMYMMKGRTSKGTRFDSWSRPAITKGPLGIVSWIELCFLFMFTALLIWSISSYTHGMFKTITRQSAAMMGVKVWKAKLQSVALMLGLVGNICLAFLFFPVTRGSSILRLFGLTSESSVKYHIWLGHAVMALFTAHGLCFIIFWADTHQLSEMLEWNKVGISIVAGEVSLFAGIAMWMTSFPRIRRKLFELFFYTHHLYIIFIVFFVFHVGFTYSCITLPGFYLFLIDRYLRFLQSQQCVCLVSARVLPCQAVELNFSKSPAVTASAAFVWNKKQKAKEMVQIQNNDIPTPMTSPGPPSNAARVRGASQPSESSLKRKRGMFQKDRQ
ncbi:hypothetical protein KY289_027176 [Solanum tuberosum]|nr:hypothetical protein KY289_027176 [Solanum tuberosum]